jgi:hypothetical protein
MAGKDNPLVKLATRLLSFVPSSASVERLFSKMGDISTKKRTRLGTKKLRDIAYIKTELRRQQAQDGVAVKCLKRKFGNSTSADKVVGRIDDEEIVQDVEETGETGNKSDDESDDNTDEAGGRATQSFTSIVQQMEADAEDDSDGEDNKLGSTAVERASASVPNRQVCFLDTW